MKKIARRRDHSNYKNFSAAARMGELAARAHVFRRGLACELEWFCLKPDTPDELRHWRHEVENWSTQRCIDVMRQLTKRVPHLVKKCEATGADLWAQTRLVLEQHKREEAA